MKPHCFIILILTIVLFACKRKDLNFQCEEDFTIPDNYNILGKWVEIISEEEQLLDKYDEWEFDFKEDNRVFVKIHHYSNSFEPPCNYLNYTEFIKGEYDVSEPFILIQGVYANQLFEEIDTTICYNNIGNFYADFISIVTCDKTIRLMRHGFSTEILDRFEIQKID